ncbi:sensor histidine kinase [Spongisporangium articulatum]|uniref:histidine kinase n=1 Tax=Spongisporangium articulatum TaxID=3362603 RepID=A0ABW8AJ12_9ACTN
MTSVPDDGPPPAGVPVAVLVATLLAAFGTIPALMGVTSDSITVGAIYSSAWLVFGFGAAVLLDRDPHDRVGRVFAGLSLTPLAVVGVSVVVSGVGWGSLTRVWTAIGWPVVAVVLAAVAWAVDLAVDRMSRRRLVWLVVLSAALFAAVIATRFLAGPVQAAMTAMLGLWTFAAVATRLVLARQFRPLDEPLVDLVLALGPFLLGGVAGLLTQWLTERVDLPWAQPSTVFVAVVVVTLAWPLSRWLRASFLQQRYGRGVLTPDDVAAITAGLHADADPRELLGQAAAMVSAASGQEAVTIILGADEPDEPSDDGRLVHHPLVVAGDRVGTLSVRSRHREGPESRQAHTVVQLIPTVALVARAVQLAVEADHARQDVARERDAERARILGDLHDGVGPVLAGMSMRVQAELRAAPTPLLRALADELADCRGDLRRIVAGLTPSALHDGDLAGALSALVDSFGAQSRTIALDTDLDRELPPEVTVAVYRSVAEGITNALRHGAADEIHVSVRCRADPGERISARVEVRDHGRGGLVVPGVGLTSLRRRAEQLGGRLQVENLQPHGVRLHVEIPVVSA